MIKLHQLKKHPKSTKRRKVVGRGLGSGHGTYSTRGGKGQTARTGHSKVPAGFEGGRQPLIRQVGKSRGFKSLQEKAYAIKLDYLTKLEDGSLVTLETLKIAGLIPKNASRAKIVFGKINKKLIVKIPVSETAKEAIVAAGGAVK